ncbi:MAG: T9SS type A sorting domain-containing protein [Flavobacteriales bacterium]|nr:T9SS type A sorting domain-containing protein [Flavobacteriales bacterium]
MSSQHDLPQQSDFYWLLQNEDRSITYTYNFGNDPGFYQYVGDINHLLTLNEQASLTSGVWYFQGAVVDNLSMEICDVTDVVILTLLGPDEEGCEDNDCVTFSTPPVDLTKSFEGFNGVQDRVQLKWYKAEPQIPYSDKDAAMCDIQFWAVRTLDPVTGAVTGVIDPVDTLQINNVKKTYSDNSPREISKWPIKYRKLGVNNSKRVDPNKRYLWRVRCECGHDDNGIESPWSQIKLFNTPDFDPLTGIFSGDGGVAQEMNTYLSPDNATKRLRPSRMNSIMPLPSRARDRVAIGKSVEERIRLFPNPAAETLHIILGIEAHSLQVTDALGRLVLKLDENFSRRQLDISTLPEGIYFLELEINAQTVRRPFVVKR